MELHEKLPAYWFWFDLDALEETIKIVYLTQIATKGAEKIQNVFNSIIKNFFNLSCEKVKETVSFTKEDASRFSV